MRVVLCDQDDLMRDMVESLMARIGHEVVGVADTNPGGVHLIETARPDAVIVDLSLDFNSDFDIIDTAISFGVRVIVFSYNADHAILERYSVAPAVVPKPDLAALEHVLERLAEHDPGTTKERERRRNPQRVAAGPVPMGVGDLQAFFEAVNAAEAGDAMTSIECTTHGDDMANELLEVIRPSDRLAAFSTAVRVFLPGGGDEGIRSLVQRISDAGLAPVVGAVTAIVVRDGELGADAFDRLKRDGEAVALPPSAPIP